MIQSKEQKKSFKKAEALHKSNLEIISNKEEVRAVIRAEKKSQQINVSKLKLAKRQSRE